jgi:hypothetical protein
MVSSPQYYPDLIEAMRNMDKAEIARLAPYTTSYFINEIKTLNRPDSCISEDEIKQLCDIRCSKSETDLRDFVARLLLQKLAAGQYTSVDATIDGKSKRKWTKVGELLDNMPKGGKSAPYTLRRGNKMHTPIDYHLQVGRYVKRATGSIFPNLCTPPWYKVHRDQPNPDWKPTYYNVPDVDKSTLAMNKLMAAMQVYNCVVEVESKCYRFELDHHTHWLRYCEKSTNWIVEKNGGPKWIPVRLCDSTEYGYTDEELKQDDGYCDPEVQLKLVDCLAYDN